MPSFRQENIMSSIHLKISRNTKKWEKSIQNNKISQSVNHHQTKIDAKIRIRRLGY